jgi:hypothetical protein
MFAIFSLFQWSCLFSRFASPFTPFPHTSLHIWALCYPRLLVDVGIPNADFRSAELLWRQVNHTALPPIQFKLWFKHNVRVCESATLNIWGIFKTAVLVVLYLCSKSCLRPFLFLSFFKLKFHLPSQKKSS